MVSRGVLAALAAAVVVVAVPVARAECGWISGHGASFNLQALVHENYYTVKDINAREKNNDGADTDADYDPHDYTYVFNVCDNIKGTIPQPPKKDDPDAPGDCPADAKTPALQIANWWNGCFVLATDNEGGKNMTWSLFDESQPHKGVTVTYDFGDKCEVDGGALTRELKVAFMCEDNVANTFDEEEQVEETDTCHYEIFIKSAYGCPVECAIVDGHVCNNHGVCGYDYDKKTAGCFCNDGWEGANCDHLHEETKGKLGGVGAVLIVLCVILTLIIVSVVYMFLKLRRLNVDPSSFNELKGLYNELGQIA